MSDQPPPRWSCWFRASPRHRWRKVAEADSQAEAWRKVLQFELSGDKTISQRDPNQEKKPK